MYRQLLPGTSTTAPSAERPLTLMSSLSSRNTFVTPSYHRNQCWFLQTIVLQGWTWYRPQSYWLKASKQVLLIQYFFRTQVPKCTPQTICSFTPWVCCLPPRKANNHKPAAAVALRKLKEAVLQTYGHRYQRACQYLEDLASNTYWEETDLTPLPWHTQDQAPLYPAQARYVMHQAVLDALAPAVPLRAVFARGAHN